MRNDSIAALLCAAGILAIASGAKAAKVTFETIVSTDIKTQGGQEIRVPIIVGGKQVGSGPVVEYKIPSIDKQDIAFSINAEALRDTKEKNLDGTTKQEFTSTTAIYGIFQGGLFNRKPLPITKEALVFTGKIDTDPNAISSSYIYPSLDIRDKTVAITKLVTKSRRIDPRPFEESANALIWQSNTQKVRSFGGCTFFFGEAGGYPSGIALKDSQTVVLAGPVEGCPASFGGFSSAVKNEKAIWQWVAGKQSTLYRSTYKDGELPIANPTVSAVGNTIVFTYDNLYLQKNGQLSTLVSKGETLPKLGKLDSLCGSDFDGKSIVFCGRNTDSAFVIYLRSGNQSKPIAFRDVKASGESLPLRGIEENPKVSGEYVLFTGGVVKDFRFFRGIYVYYRGQIVKVVGAGSVIKGKTVEDVSVGRRPISGNQVVFAVKFTDRTSSVIKAKLSF